MPERRIQAHVYTLSPWQMTVEMSSHAIIVRPGAYNTQLQLITLMNFITLEVRNVLLNIWSLKSKVTDECYLPCSILCSQKIIHAHLKSSKIYVADHCTLTIVWYLLSNTDLQNSQARACIGSYPTPITWQEEEEGGQPFSREMLELVWEFVLSSHWYAAFEDGSP